MEYDKKKKDSLMRVIYENIRGQFPLELLVKKQTNLIVPQWVKRSISNELYVLFVLDDTPKLWNIF